MTKTIWPKKLTIHWLKEQYSLGSITPEQVIALVIERAEADAEKNIWITPPAMDWIRPYLDRLADLDPAQVPLWGMPFAIKDNIQLAGIEMSAACPAFTYTPEEDAVVVQRLIAAGAIPVGKANLDQFATGLVGTRSPYGETHNSLRSELISGGSSSGSAVAVALGHAAFSLGTDTAGSGRVPAALNGLVGFKSSLGAWPTEGLLPACESLDCITSFTHSLSDALLVDEVVRCVHETDPWSRPLPQPQAKLPKKVLLPRETPAFYGPYAEQYAQAWGAAVTKWQGLGVQVELVDTTFMEQAASILYDGPWIAERWAALGSFVEAHPGEVFPVTERILRSGASEKYTAASLFQAQHQMQRYKLQARQLLQDAVLVLPTAGGTYTREQVRQEPVATNSNMGKYTNHCNLLDLCAVAIPAGEADHELPFGITLFGLADQEGLIIGGAQLFLGEEEVGKQAVTAGQIPDTTMVAVCGLHMRGFPLERQMHACGAKFIEEVMSAERYQFVKLPTEPAKPGMIKRSESERSRVGAVQLELWEMPLASFGAFVASIPAPLGIGKVELADGREVPGFICEAYATEGVEDITAVGSWRNV